jgi:hypothetical protein
VTKLASPHTEKAWLFAGVAVDALIKIPFRRLKITLIAFWHL